MTTKPRIVVPAYGDWQVWGPRLGTFLRLLREHEPDREVMVISDGPSCWPKEARHGLAWFDVPEASTLPVYSNLNMSGILLAYAAIELSPCLVMTLDCEVVGPLPEGDWMDSSIAFGRDIPARRKRVVNGIGFEELSVAVAWFGDTWPGGAFLDDWERFGAQGQREKCPFWEQVIWSYVWAKCPEDCVLYPDGMNWSHTMPRGDACVIHHHGKAAKGAFDRL